MLTNQICVVKDKHYIKFPGTKERINAGADINKLQEVRVRPRGDAFEISIVYEVPDIGIRPISDAKFSGSRIQRGLYKHYDGSISNADINGAANILRKAFPKVTQWDRGVVDTPCAVRVA